MCRVAVVVSSANMELELVRQCLDRALVLDDRVSKFSVQLGEWPGDMAKLLDFLSREDVRSAASALQTLGATQWCLQFIGLCGFSPARLLDVCHRTQSDRSDLFKAKVRTTFFLFSLSDVKHGVAVSWQDQSGWWLVSWPAPPGASARF